MPHARRDFDLRIDWDDQRRLMLSTALKGHGDADRLAPMIALAGAQEALAMATGDYIPEGLPGVRLYRVFCLIQAGMPLPEAEELVACIFKIKPTEAKGVVNKAFARFSVQLEDRIVEAIRNLLEAATWSGEELRWQVRIPWAFVHERITTEIDALALPRPARSERGTFWAFPNETYQDLRQYYDLPIRHRGPGRAA